MSSLKLDDDFYNDHRTRDRRGRRADLDKFVKGYNSDRYGAKAHAWNPNNKRAICSVVVLHTDEPPEPFNGEWFNNCATCQRQWDRWGAEG